MLHCLKSTKVHAQTNISTFLITSLKYTPRCRIAKSNPTNPEPGVVAVPKRLSWKDRGVLSLAWTTKWESQSEQKGIKQSEFWKLQLCFGSKQLMSPPHHREEMNILPCTHLTLQHMFLPWSVHELILSSGVAKIPTCLWMKSHGIRPSRGWCDCNRWKSRQES